MVYRSCEHEYTFSIFVSFSRSPKAVAPKNKICIFLSPLCIYFIKWCIKNSRSPALGILGSVLQCTSFSYAVVLISRIFMFCFLMARFIILKGIQML